MPCETAPRRTNKGRFKNVPVEDRIWAQLVVVENCWEWTGTTSNRGYGYIYVAGRYVPAHRASYEIFRGPIPDGMTLDHLCRNRRCVNPHHLEIVSGRENTLRGVGPTAANSKKTHCIHGHPFDEKNTYHETPTIRRCRTCVTARGIAYRKRLKAKR